MSKKAVWPFCQKLLALISSLALLVVLADFSLNFSFCIGISGGSDITLWHILVNKTVSVSLMVSCLLETNPPFLQDKAWVTSNWSPHGQKLGRSFSLMLYLIRRASRSSVLVRSKPWSTNGRAFNQELAPFSRACSKCLDTSSGSLDLTSSIRSFRVF